MHGSEPVGLKNLEEQCVGVSSLALGAAGMATIKKCGG